MFRAAAYIPNVEFDSDVCPDNKPMWTCEHCGARNWDEASTCHKCLAPIAPEQARAIQETPPQLDRSRLPRTSHPFPIPRQVELLDGGFFTDGGTVHLVARDHAGTEYSIWLHARLRRKSYFSVSCGLCTHPSPDLLQVISMLQNATVAPEIVTKASDADIAIRPPDLVIGDDLQRLCGALGTQDEFLRELRDNLVQKLQKLRCQEQVTSPSPGL